MHVHRNASEGHLGFVLARCAETHRCAQGTKDEIFLTVSWDQGAWVPWGLGSARSVRKSQERVENVARPFTVVSTGGAAEAGEPS